MVSATTAVAATSSTVSTASTVIPLTATPLPRARDVPSTFVASIKSWWSAGEKEGAASEERLLRKLPFFQSSTWPRINSDLPIIGTSTRIQLPNPKHLINTFSITPLNPASTESKYPAPPPAVVLHGYGAGLGFFFLNFPTLGLWTTRTSSPVYALDWLGMGRSSRPPFKIHAKRTDIPARVHEAESFFVDSLEEWREKMNLNKMQLVAHSLGAYLACCYALRYPERVSRLVLLSPAGVPRGPDAEAPEREVVADQASIRSSDGSSTLASNGSSRRGNQVESASRENVRDMKEEQKEAKRKETTTQKLFTYMWEEGWSPFQVVRTLTVFGPMLIGRYSSRRFSDLSEEEIRDVNDYILNITLAKGSGEYCISHILAPFAHARLPLVDRISPLKMPVTFVYGEHDWMDPEGGAESVRRLREAGNQHAKMYIIKNAGHHVYLDNAQAVNDLLMKELSKA